MAKLKFTGFGIIPSGSGTHTDWLRTVFRRSPIDRGQATAGAGSDAAASDQSPQRSENPTSRRHSTNLPERTSTSAPAARQAVLGTTPPDSTRRSAEASRSAPVAGASTSHATQPAAAPHVPASATPSAATAPTASGFAAVPGGPDRSTIAAIVLAEALSAPPDPVQAHLVNQGRIAGMQVRDGETDAAIPSELASSLDFLVTIEQYSNVFSASNRPRAQAAVIAGGLYEALVDTPDRANAGPGISPDVLAPVVELAADPARTDPIAFMVEVSNLLSDELPVTDEARQNRGPTDGLQAFGRLAVEAAGRQLNLLAAQPHAEVNESRPHLAWTNAQVTNRFHALADVMILTSQNVAAAHDPSGHWHALRSQIMNAVIAALQHVDGAQRDTDIAHLMRTSGPTYSGFTDAERLEFQTAIQAARAPAPV